VPWAVFLSAWEALSGHLAIQQLHQAMAALIARVDSTDVGRELDKVERRAFPGD